MIIRLILIRIFRILTGEHYTYSYQFIQQIIHTTVRCNSRKLLLYGFESDWKKYQKKAIGFGLYAREISGNSKLQLAVYTGNRAGCEYSVVKMAK